MKKNNMDLKTVFFAACAMIWTGNVIVDIAFPKRKDRSTKLALDSIFLMTWVTALAAALKKNDTQQ